MRKLLGFGAAATVSWDDAATSLNSNMGGLLAQGDSWMTYRDPSGTPVWNSAITAYKSAGAQGASVVGPTIDSAGNPGVTQPLTQKAWTLNSALQAVNPAADASKADAELAQGYAKQMYGLYQQAIALGRGNVASGGDMLRTGLILGGVGALAYAWYASAKHEKRLRRRR